VQVVCHKSQTKEVGGGRVLSDIRHYSPILLFESQDDVQGFVQYMQQEKIFQSQKGNQNAITNNTTAQSNPSTTITPWTFSPRLPSPPLTTIARKLKPLPSFPIIGAAAAPNTSKGKKRAASTGGDEEEAMDDNHHHGERARMPII